MSEDTSARFDTRYTQRGFASDRNLAARWLGVDGRVSVVSVGQDILTGDWDNWLARLRKLPAWLLAEFNSESVLTGWCSHAQGDNAL